MIDLYLSHWPDMATPIEETLGAYQRLIEQGKIRWCGASNLSVKLLEAALAAAKAKGLPRYEVLQPEYNLADRREFESGLADLCQREEIGVITYFSLAKGFLTGKYRSEADLSKSPRGDGVKAYLNPRGFRILDALEAVAARHKAKPAEVALAWAMARPGVTAPIASATSVEQTESLVRATELTLTGPTWRRSTPPARHSAPCSSTDAARLLRERGRGRGFALIRRPSPAHLLPEREGRAERHLEPAGPLPRRAIRGAGSCRHWCAAANRGIRSGAASCSRSDVAGSGR